MNIVPYSWRIQTGQPPYVRFVHTEQEAQAIVRDKSYAPPGSDPAEVHEATEGRWVDELYIATRIHTYPKQDIFRLMLSSDWRPEWEGRRYWVVDRFSIDSKRAYLPDYVHPLQRGYYHSLHLPRPVGPYIRIITALVSGKRLLLFRMMYKTMNVLSLPNTFLPGVGPVMSFVLLRLYSYGLVLAPKHYRPLLRLLNVKLRSAIIKRFPLSLFRK